MVRTPSCDKNGLKKGTWTPEEDMKLMAYVTRYGSWNWRQLPKFAGLARCGKSCRLRWLNYLRPNIRRGNYTQEEEEIIIKLHEKLGNKWSVIASHLPGRTDNEVKNHWNTTLKKRFGKNAVVNENVEAAKSNGSESAKQEGDSVQSKGFFHGSPPTSSAANEDLLMEDEFDFLNARTEAVNENNVCTESYLADFSNAPIEIVPDIANSAIQGSDTNETLNNAWALSPQSLSSESLVLEDDHYAFLEATQPSVTENFWTEPYVADMSLAPNELLATLATESDEYFSLVFDADLWSQSDTRDLHISHSNE